MTHGRAVRCRLPAQPLRTAVHDAARPGHHNQPLSSVRGVAPGDAQDAAIPIHGRCCPAGGQLGEHRLQQLQVGDGVEPIGVAGMAGDEDELVFLGAVLAPFEIVLDLGRLVVFINTEETDIKIVARVGEVIGIAAEKSDVAGGEAAAA